MCRLKHPLLSQTNRIQKIEKKKLRGIQQTHTFNTHTQKRHTHARTFARTHAYIYNTRTKFKVKHNNLVGYRSFIGNVRDGNDGGDIDNQTNENESSQTK